MTQAKNKGSLESERGFTLPEVLIVIVIMGILFGIATSTWFRVIEGRQVDSATNQMVSDLRFAHTRATNQLTDWRVQIFLGRGDQSSGMDYKLTRPSDVTLERYLPDNSMIASSELNDSGGSKIITFQPDGAAQAVGGFGDTDGDGEIRITVSVDGNPTGSMSVVPTTSRVKVVP